MVMAQLADVVNKLQPADSWRAPVTAADVASVSIEEMTARMKVPRFQGSGACVPAAKP